MPLLEFEWVCGGKVEEYRLQSDADAVVSLLRYGYCLFIKGMSFRTLLIEVA